MNVNRFAAASRIREGGRLANDTYETPPEVVDVLLQHVSFDGPILEPAAGSGRIARRLEQRLNIPVTVRDLKTGDDYLSDTTTWNGDVVTNPPYHKRMAEMFVMHALATTTGRIAMLLQSGFLFGQQRAEDLFRLAPPERVIIVPWRIRFFLGGTNKRIPSQTYDHVWVVWNNRRLNRTKTVLHWPDNSPILTT